MPCVGWRRNWCWHCQKKVLSATGLHKSIFLLTSHRKPGPCITFNMRLGSIKFIENINFLKIKQSLIYFVKSLPSFCNLDLKNNFFFFFPPKCKRSFWQGAEQQGLVCGLSALLPAWPWREQYAFAKGTVKPIAYNMLYSPPFSPFLFVFRPLNRCKSSYSIQATFVINLWEKIWLNCVTKKLGLLSMWALSGYIVTINNHFGI